MCRELLLPILPFPQPHYPLECRKLTGLMFGLTRPYIPIPYRQVSAHVVTHRAALQAAKEKAAERVEVRMIVFLHIPHLFLFRVDPLHDPCIVSLPSLIPTTIITCNKQARQAFATAAQALNSYLAHATEASHQAVSTAGSRSSGLKVKDRGRRMRVGVRVHASICTYPHLLTRRTQYINNFGQRWRRWGQRCRP